MALYLGKDKIAGTNTSSIIGDTLPVGAVIDYDGTEVPANWELVEDEAGNSTSNIANSIIILNSDLTADKVQKVLSGLEKNSETGEYSIKTAMFWEYPYQNDTDITTFIYIPVIQAMTSIEDNIVGVFFKSPVIEGTSYQVIAAIQNPESNPTTFASLEARGIIEYVEDLGLSHNSAALAVSQGKILNEKIEAIPSMIALSTKTTTSGGNIVRWGSLEAGVYYADQRDYTINTGDTSEVGYDMWSVAVSQNSVIIVTRDTESTWNGKFNIITSTGNKQYTVTTEYFYRCIDPYFILHKGNEAMGYYTEQFFYQDGMSWRTFIETNPDIGFYDGGGQIGYGDPNDGLYLTVDSGRNHFVDATHLIQPRDYYVPISFEEDPITNIITFTVGETEYTALRGMSWQEWIDSSYNTQGFLTSNNIVVTNTYRPIYVTEGSDQIEAYTHHIIAGSITYAVGTSPLPA